MLAWFRILLIALVVVWFTGPAAQAHSELISSSPAPGSRLQEAPDRVTLQFSEDVDPAYAAMTLSVDGELVATLRPARVPAVPGALVAGIAVDERDEGSWQVGYRVTSVDGHPIEGVVEFDVGDLSGSDPAKTETETEDSSLSTTMVLLWSGLGAAVLALLTLLGRRLRKRTPR